MMILYAVAYAKNMLCMPINANYLHQPLEYLHSIPFLWLFEAWGIDEVGHITPPSSKVHRYILVIITYFSKW